MPNKIPRTGLPLFESRLVNMARDTSRVIGSFLYFRFSVKSSSTRNDTLKDRGVKIL